MDLYGNDIKAVVTQTPEGCQVECQKNTDCVAITWASPTHCFLKSALPLPGLGPKGVTIVSGPRDCGIFRRDICSINKLTPNKLS